MCWRVLFSALQRAGVEATESQVRWAIKTGRVSRPPLDGSLRFHFSNENVAELVAHFSERQTREPVPCN
jgi:hypothetical protein